MTPEDPDEHPLAGIDRLLAGALHLINLAEAQDRAPFEQIWWSLRGMKRGVVAALASIVNHKRRLSPTQTVEMGPPGLEPGTYRL